MKKILVIVLLLLVTVAATTPEQKRQSETAKSINGTWELVSHYIYDGVNITDTIIEKGTGARQIKMYNNDKVMWTRIVPSVSAEWFGYGSYRTTESKLFETLEYGSSTMMEMMDSIEVFEFELILKENSFSQITLDAEGYRVHSENYVRID
ncbi:MULTISPECIES: hypothetical protein [unclassified Croceitalea]|uniref:hypothetical protein n=1 Tax=unclassified Croceitalea TaxID=2632280 RepID=UPI0030D6E3B3